jgi:uncharacterized protein YkwD
MPRYTITALDTARHLISPSDLEKEVILESNKARVNPAKYADMYIRPRLDWFQGSRYCPPGGEVFVTQEGRAAAAECLAAMRGAAAVGILVPARGLYLAAKDHAGDQGATGQTGHDGSDGSTPEVRIGRYGVLGGALFGYGENIAYGMPTARDIVCGLLIDDGVPGRGHRHTMLDPDFTQTGACCGTHPVYRRMCVITYAVGFWDTPI